jgi:elongation factor Ts
VAKTDEYRDFCRDIAMQIAASKPEYVSREEVPAEVIEKEKAILRAQALNEGKPEKIVERMVEGRIDKFFKEFCLLEQPFIKDPDQTVQQLLHAKVSKLGENIGIRRFVRYELGEGIEKKRDDFAEEVMAQVNKS